MYPLRFEPIFRRYLWGGRRLATSLGKSIGPENDYAESWELVDRENDQSIVTDGPLAGKTLHALVAESGAELLGTRIWETISDPSLPPQLQGRFPLLLKFLDANRTLSIQVHPDDQMALRQEPPDLGKTEAWYVIDTTPESLIYAGLKSGVGHDDLRLAVERGTTNEVVHTLKPKVGDCIFVPAGTVHAIGEGLLIAEIQQASDTTFRLFDWNRLDADGNPRQLHVQQAIQATDYHCGPVRVQQPVATGHEQVTELIRCDKFMMRNWSINSQQAIDTQDRFRILTVIRGAVQIEGDVAEMPLVKGQSILLPACLQKIDIRPQQECEFLEISIP